MDAVAAEAMVSRATAYRYFPSVEALLIEAPLDGAVPSPDEVFADDRSTDAFERVAKAEAALYDAVKSNEAQLRLMLAASLERKAKGLATDGIPIRQNRRQGLIEAALAPVRDRLTDATYEKLCASLALIFGTESMVVFNDVLGVDEKAAKKVKAWAMRALVDAALDSSTKR
jgi:AcrR family transcriptional regulator